MNILNGVVQLHVMSIRLFKKPNSLLLYEKNFRVIPDVYIISDTMKQQATEN